MVWTLFQLVRFQQTTINLLFSFCSTSFSLTLLCFHLSYFISFHPIVSFRSASFSFIPLHFLSFYFIFIFFLFPFIPFNYLFIHFCFLFHFFLHLPFHFILPFSNFVYLFLNITLILMDLSKIILFAK